MANQDINVRARLTADDEASPVVRRLLGDIKRLEQQLKTNFAKSPIAGKLIDDKVIKHLKATSGELDTLTPRYKRWARALKDSNEMSATGWDKLTGKIKEYERAFTASGNKLNGKQQKELRDLIRKAQAYKAVWNETYQVRGRLERNLASMTDRLAADTAKRRQRHADTEVKNRLSLARDLFKMEVDNERHLLGLRRARERNIASQRAGIRGGVRGVVGNTRSMIGRADGSFFNSPFFYSTLAAGAAAKGVQSSFSSRMRAQKAEINAQMFGEMSAADIAKERKSWINRFSVKQGFNASEGIDAFTETIKAGISDRSVARAVTESILAGAAGLDIDTKETTRLVGRLYTITQDPRSVDPKAIESYMNSIAIVGAKTAADSNEVISGMRRGMGSLAGSSLKVGELAAFVGAGTSAGIQPGPLRYSNPAHRWTARRRRQAARTARPRI